MDCKAQCYELDLHLGMGTRCWKVSGGIRVIGGGLLDFLVGWPNLVPNCYNQYIQVKANTYE